MRAGFLLATLLSASLFPHAATACEGPCITGITAAFVGNYSEPVQKVYADIALSITRALLPPTPSAIGLAGRMIEPFLEAYERDAYSRAEQAIFPGFFHGKCQRDGVDPPGCPIPDCAVICGTPGSLVHFYSTLTWIAFNTTADGITDTFRPAHSKPRAQLLQAVLSARRTHARDYHGAFMSDKHVEGVLDDILKKDVGRDGLAKECQKGGDALGACSWKGPMVEFISTFP
ncbi:hypothetical protein BOTBODRAFT_180930 [Botryobasidium botryosum FD-172 SS1]|uniref:Uncharacterized protein n=1 Tax=Botryobasidium botryosum (strain FD-172 SS1) TaxID=930990 RepID=A0A067LVI6_BOTB1|nr:hypothetical protein BOTBODRAFT_180930 [Botryobasidium botryosum FD-172 SS1]